MESVTVVLVMLLAVVVSSACARLSPIPVPQPLVQIAFGALIGAATSMSVTLEPEIFFLLFLPPLLFLDGWRIPKEGLFRDASIIMELAFGLVVFTVLGVGYFVNWLIPAMPLAVAFALAAVLSPTDPIAVSSIASRTSVPGRLMHILEGESLLNDASGLVCMRFAVAAALTGAFSLPQAFGTFLWVAIGGVAIGVGVTWAVVRLKSAISGRVGEETGSYILVSLLVPFAAYLFAEHLHCSGILAAVGAGVAMSYAELGGGALAVTRVRRHAVWDSVQFAFNGVIFVLLGEQLPRIVAGAARVVRETGHHDPVWLIVYVVAINVALAALRFTWVWVSLRFTLFRAARRGRKVEKLSWRILAATTLAGARGAITLAGVMSLPLVLRDGSPFPARDLAIFLAAGVIIVSLAAAAIGLPFLMKGLNVPPEPQHQREEDAARIAAATAAIEAVAHAQHQMSGDGAAADLYAEAGARVMAVYRARIDARSKTDAEADLALKAERIERELRLVALRAERTEYFRLARRRALGEDALRRLVRDADLLETQLNPG
ncbi:Na+/H+ antiporter [Methylocella sp.]|uniref:Na+/H+ antiporter n=1 Tax=Methylocella sp. TaxID=1978226 RepID=UPI003783FFAB